MGAAEASGVDRPAHYDWLKKSPAYAEAFAACQFELGQFLEDLAIERAKGYKRILYYNGKPIRNGRNFATEPAYDVALHMMTLKRFRPNEYRDRSVTEVTGTVNIAERLHAARQRIKKPKPDDEPES